MPVAILRRLHQCLHVAVSPVVSIVFITMTVICVAVPGAHAQAGRVGNPDIVNPAPDTGPSSEFHLARLVFSTNIYSGWGPGRPWWRIDWPEAETHFLGGVSRYTLIDAFNDSVHVELNDKTLFDYPWLFAQQVGRWRISDRDAQRLGEYLLRGGFILADDIHGPRDWAVFSDAMQRALPHHEIVDVDPNDQTMAVLYELERDTQIPGRRHLYGTDSQGEAIVQMPYGPQKWRGIKDENGRWMMAINYNMDMGDSWEHADDPQYPLAMTALGYRLGINYVLYALTH